MRVGRKEHSRTGGDKDTWKKEDEGVTQGSSREKIGHTCSESLRPVKPVLRSHPKIWKKAGGGHSPGINSWKKPLTPK